MNEKYKNKYRIPSARAAWWDYGSAGAYFITICTAGRQHFFGEIQQGILHLSHIGVLADVLWHEIPHHAHQVELGAFVVMPNHIHGILILKQGEIINNGGNGDGDGMVGWDGWDGGDVETGHALSLPTPPTPPAPPAPPDAPKLPKTVHYRFQNPGKNTISTIVGSYKSALTKHARRMGFEFSWQTRFHDHIIRNDAEYQRINDYIESNPTNWAKDKFY
jgi:REP element-mobilizing transposase RayT